MIYPIHDKIVAAWMAAAKFAALASESAGSQELRQVYMHDAFAYESQAVLLDDMITADLDILVQPVLEGFEEASTPA